MFHTLTEKFVEGGMVMWAILTCMAIGFAVLWDRFRTIMAATSVSKEEVLSHISSYILQGNIDKAISMTAQIRSPLTNIIRAGLVAVMNGKDNEEIQTAMDAVALREVPRIEKRIPLLAMLSNISTLLGLLGTVMGMIGAFGAVANVAPAEKATLLASSIAEAMNATAFGLLVAIPLLGGFGFLQTKAQEIVSDIHEASVATLNFIISNRSKIESQAQGAQNRAGGHR